MEADPPLVLIRGLTRVHPPSRGRGARTHPALAGVDLTIRRGAALALVGQSGSGKSTLARCLARLEEPTSGEIRFDGADLLAVRGRALRPFRARIQLVLQDSATALDPRLTAAEIVAEPLDILERGAPRDRPRRVMELMESVGLPEALLPRRPMELSGGQRQRLAIARALAVEPELMILDEAFAGLDAPVQAQIASLLGDLRARRGLTYLYVSHDLGLMTLVADEAAVLCEGRIVEEGAIHRLFAEPRHPHTRALVESVPALPALAAHA